VDERTASSLDKNMAIKPSARDYRISMICGVSNDEPHPQVRDAFGLTTENPVQSSHR